jgi:hypothetical protein
VQGLQLNESQILAKHGAVDGHDVDYVPGSPIRSKCPVYAPNYRSFTGRAILLLALQQVFLSSIPLFAGALLHCLLLKLSSLIRTKMIFWDKVLKRFAAAVHDGHSATEPGVVLILLCTVTHPNLDTHPLINVDCYINF